MASQEFGSVKSHVVEQSPNCCVELGKFPRYKFIYSSSFKEDNQ